MAIGTSAGHNFFLRQQSNASNGPVLSLSRAPIPTRVKGLLHGANTNLLATLHGGGANNAAAVALSGPKALLTAVLELGLSYTLERDDVLHGFIYGGESLMDLPNAQTFLQDQANPETKPQALTDVALLRFQRFQTRLNQRLADLQATGQPEIPRLVGHTLRLLDLLRDSWSATPPSSLEVARKTNGVGLVLYGEPYARYTLLQSSNLTSGWTSTSITNLRSADSPFGPVDPPLPNPVEPQRYYRAVQLVP